MDIEGLIAMARVFYNDLREKGLIERRNCDDGLIDNNELLSRQNALMVTNAERLIAEGASPYQCELVTRAADIVWSASIMTDSARDLDELFGDYLVVEQFENPDIQELPSRMDEIVNMLLTGIGFTHTVQHVATKFGRTDLEVSMYLRRLIEALLKD